MKNKSFSPERKNMIKRVRSILQGIIILFAVMILIKALGNFSVYKPNTKAATLDKNRGFIAISYFGVNRSGDSTLISTEALEKQIKALKDDGYVTITQNDILDYYKSGKALPEKSLFLLFEDGRTDTVIFSQKILEQYNYKATILTYADKFEKKDPKFLKPNDLLKLKDSSYWELGTNGYRLEYINVFDKESNFLGRLNSLQFSKEAPKIERRYNHYLMDYIRDENGIPTESYEEMRFRIESDYKNLSSIYKKEIGEVPNLYALMHSNTGKFGTNNNASEVNSKNIKELFNMNFNREGYSLNLPNNSIYDLTRLQPQAYWSTNHLLMRIYDDTKKSTKFVIGDESKSKNFQKLKGQAEFIDDKIILTSEPKENGILKLLNVRAKDVKISTTLQGNIIGSQTIYLRSNEDMSNSISVQLVNNIVNVAERVKGSKKIIYTLDLNDKNKNEKIDIKELGNKKVDITIKDKKLTLDIDGKKIVEDLNVTILDGGNILLESAWGKDGYSQRNIEDDVYDGVFRGLKITNLNDEVIYDSTLKGMDRVNYSVKNSYDKLVNWFVDNL